MTGHDKRSGEPDRFEGLREIVDPSHGSLVVGEAAERGRIRARESEPRDERWPMGCEHEKRRFVIEVAACPACDPLRVQTLEALQDTVRMEAAVEELTQAISDASAEEAAVALRALAETSEPPVRCGLEPLDPPIVESLSRGLSQPHDQSETPRLLTEVELAGTARVGSPMPSLGAALLAGIAEGVADREALELHSPPTEARCRCCNRRLKDVESIAAGEGPLCREGNCKRKRGG